MPEKMEAALRETANRKGLKGDRADAYVYGTMRQYGWKPNKEKKNKKRSKKV